VAVALADKIDTLTGFWAIDEKPTGSKDPYALRRAALGVLRLVLENKLSMSLTSVLSHGCQRAILRREWEIARNAGNALLEITGFGDFSTKFESEKWSEETLEIASDLLAFIHDRLKVHLRAEGVPHDVIDACLAMDGADDLTLLVKRATALATVLKTEDGTNLVQGFKRANNILTQAEEKDGVEYSFGADVKFAETAEEKALFAALDATEAKIKPAMAAEDFATAMEAMASLRAPIDAFFDAVQVNSDNQIVRRNRLNLLSRIRQTCLQVADLTRIEG
jgi:glycyl-tRNA synthetase beta chain